jgi:aspartyl-tRNA(Asn)/glutamyl-tRNA(Gln) amidotransferase subunit C
MTMTRDDIDRIAALAKLDLGPAEKERLAADLEPVLAEIAAIQAIDTTGVEPLTGFAGDAAPRADRRRP